MPPDDYASIPSSGKLKLKGVADGRVDKKKRKKKPRSEEVETEKDEARHEDSAHNEADEFQDKSVMLRKLQEEDEEISKSEQQDHAEKDKPDMKEYLQTDAERRFEEQRRKRLEERLKREGVKTHKQRVEELNRYLSGLSEHHDMPKIGPG